MIGNRFTKKIVLAVIMGVLSMASLVNAQVKNIQASGSYTIGDGDESINNAKQKAKENAMREAVEIAGVYVETYSKVENNILTADEIRTIAGNILKIVKCEIKPDLEKNSNTITYICNIEAIIDEDAINLKAKMEEKKIRDDYDALKKHAMELEAAIAKYDSLLQQYKEKESKPYDRRMVEKELYKQGLFIEQSIVKNVSFNNNKDNSIISSLLDVESKNANRIITEATKEDAFNLYRSLYIQLSNRLGAPIEGAPSENYMLWRYSGQIIKISTWGNKVGISREYPRKRNEMNHIPISRELLRECVDEISGSWYDSKGNLVLTIGDGYINGCEVTSGYDFVGKGGNGVYRIKEATGYRDIKLYKIGTFGKYWIMNDKVGLRRTLKPDYSESVNGVGLGMGKDEANALLGRPSNSYNVYGCEVWDYEDFGIKLYFKGDIIEQIGLMNSGNWHFDKSGLNYKDSLATIKLFYKAGSYSSDHFEIGKKEYLWYANYPREMKMSLFSN